MASIQRAEMMVSRKTLKLFWTVTIHEVLRFKLWSLEWSLSYNYVKIANNNIKVQYNVLLK